MLKRLLCICAVLLLFVGLNGCSAGGDGKVVTPDNGAPSGASHRPKRDRDEEPAPAAQPPAQQAPAQQ